jgi:hypothetical protein
VTEVLVCNPRKIPLLKQGNKSDKIDARKLAERLRLHDLKPVYHGETRVRMLRELARSYLTVGKDLSRVMNRLKALYRSWAIRCAGRDAFGPKWMLARMRPLTSQASTSLVRHWLAGCNGTWTSSLPSEGLQPRCTRATRPIVLCLDTSTNVCSQHLKRCWKRPLQRE